jgi:pimeloyl-ACP methyl ester carboxylesterase
MSTTVETVMSADGTHIRLERAGRGAPVILVGGAFNDRSTVAALAAALVPEFTAITYDRRGRGDSGNNDTSFDVAREFDDLAAVIGGAGGAASVFGHSSGGVLHHPEALRPVLSDFLGPYAAGSPGLPGC